MTMTSMPARIVAGDSLTLGIAAGSYPAADGWAVSLTLQPIAGGTPVEVGGTDGAQEWVLTLTSAVSANLSIGAHRYLIAATKAGERSTIAFGEVLVLANPASDATDQRSPARRALDAIDAVIEQRASSADMKFVFEDGRSIEKVPHADLLRLRAHYARIVEREKRARAGPRRVKVRL
ncbi:MAG: hypothetical protein KBO59_23955 [Achromobacter sp.]|nr:hypothetical protein [Achromobacter sp.]